MFRSEVCPGFAFDCEFFLRLPLQYHRSRHLFERLKSRLLVVFSGTRLLRELFPNALHGFLSLVTFIAMGVPLPLDGVARAPGRAPGESALPVSRSISVRLSPTTPASGLSQFGFRTTRPDSVPSPLLGELMGGPMLWVHFAGAWAGLRTAFGGVF